MTENETEFAVGESIARPASPELAARRAWRARRMALERHSQASTPDGPRRDIGRRIFSRVLRRTGRAMKGVGLHRPFARAARRLRLAEITLSFARLPPAFDGYRILHLSDPHFDGNAGLGEAAAALVRGLAVDLCAITGDFRFAHRGPFTERGVLEDVALLRDAISARDGVVATLGNHDPHELLEPLEELGVRVLVNEGMALRRAGGRLWITGTDDVYRFYTEAARAALAAFPACEGDFGIALVHSPDLAVAAAAAKYDLYLTGHTHAGQICFPWGAPVVTHLRCEKSLARGLWRVGGLIGHTSPGLGTSALPIRLFCPGEATVLTLRRDATGAAQ